MKKIAILSFIISLFLSLWVFAWDEETSRDQYRATTLWDFNLEVEVEGREVELQWDSFSKNEEFIWYRFISSQITKDPVYPADGGRFLWGNVGVKEAVFRLHAWEHYVRLCAITQELNDRGVYCSKVSRIQLGENAVVYDQGESHTPQKIDKSVETEVKKPAVKKPIVQKEITAEKISTDLKRHIDEKLENFILTLEDEGNNNEQIAAILNTIIIKLDAYKKQDRYIVIASYMQDVLRHYVAQYSDDLDIFNELFGEFR